MMESKSNSDAAAVDRSEVVNAYTINMQNSLIKDMWRLYQDRVRSDIMIQVQERNFHAHRSILSLRSRYFHAMLESGFKESSQSSIVINDCEPDDFEHLLRYIYTGQIVYERLEDLIELFFAGK